MRLLSVMRSQPNATPVFLIGLVTPFRERTPLLFGLTQLLALGWSVWALMRQGPHPLDRPARLLLRMVWALAVLALVITAIGACLGGVDVLQAARDFRDYLVFCLVLTLLVKADVRPPVPALLLGCGAGMLIEVSLRGSPFYGRFFDDPASGYRYMAGFLSPNEYGAMASLVAVTTVSLIRANPRRIVTYAPLVVLSVNVLIASVSRGAMIATVFGLCYALLLPMRGIRGLVMSLVAAALATAALWHAAITYHEDPHFSFLGRLTDRSLERAEEGRLFLTRLAWRGFVSSGYAGQGLGWFSATTGGETATPHNEVTKALCELGLPGAMLVVGVLFFSLWFGVARRGIAAVRVYAAGCAAFAVNDMFYSHLFRAKMSVLFALLLAGALVSASVARRRPAGPMCGRGRTEPLASPP